VLARIEVREVNGCVVRAPGRAWPRGWKGKEAFMRSKLWLKQSRGGFTLIELLAVIAIIGILAAIVIPNVTRYIARSRVTKAVSEIKNAQLGLTGALSDTGRNGFRDFLTPGEDGQLRWLDCVSFVIAAQVAPAGFCDSVNLSGVSDPTTAVAAAMSFYESFFYELLRQGKNSADLQAITIPEVRQKLGSSYMDIGNDPWGNRYHFWMGSLRGPVPLRAYRVLDAVDVDDPGFTAASDAYIFDAAQRSAEQNELPGQPPEDDTSMVAAFGTSFAGIRAYGYPASRDLPVYIWSSGPNLVNDGHLLNQMGLGVDQSAPAFVGGGDDPNNWDNESGWENAPKF